MQDTAAPAQPASKRKRKSRAADLPLVADLPLQSSGDDLSLILASLQTMRDGDFSVRLPGSWTGITGKIADTFNEIVANNQQMAEELNRIGQVVGKARPHARAHSVAGNARAPGARWKSP